ncbi:MAG: nuclear transport factor 2 family protein [Acidobacteriota bacterium]|nr:nuclear transport factor 2 family protein [Acidobacteriota bacterium]
MKVILLITAISILAANSVSAQSAQRNDSLEQEIRKLDLANAEAVLRSDITALDKLWAEDFTVNAPGNRVIKGKKEVFELIRAGIIKYSSFVREIETVLVHGDTVVVMGLETVKPIGNAPGAGQTLRRRFTNIWMKRQGQWQLTARHANIICQT